MIIGLEGHGRRVLAAFVVRVLDVALHRAGRGIGRRVIVDPFQQAVAVVHAHVHAVGLLVEKVGEDVVELDLHRGLGRQSQAALWIVGIKGVPAHVIERRIHTRITDSGLKELRPLKNLRFLVLRATAVTGAGLRELAGMSKLGYLDVSHTKVAKADVGWLKGVSVYLGEESGW